MEEPFAFGESFIHRMSPEIKIAAAFILSLPAAVSQYFPVLLLYLGISFCLVMFADLKPADLLKRLKPLFLFLLMIWIILPLTAEGQVLYEWYWIKITRPGLVLCTGITLKSISIVLILTSLLATMPVAALGNGLQKLHVPDKFVFLLLMCYRYIAVIEEEYRRLMRAARFRGFKPGTNLHSYKIFAYLAGMLFVRASLRAQRVHRAMLCRGFNGTFHTLNIYHTNGRDWLFLAGICIISLCLTIYNWSKI
jgi:cobalt/nickel transport system permease protein